MTVFKEADRLLEQLEQNGYEAYYVGGCVRDHILGRKVNDIDITTNALPDDMFEVFCKKRVIPTGLKHGTVTVIHNDTPYEITTFRIDGSYTDSRRPDNVQFTNSLEEDLKRRDFTVNAMAMNRHGEIIDPYGGRNDLEKRLIRCVGTPSDRFNEDALRILRALRFASQLGFEIDTDTSSAIFELSDNLSKISAERIRVELDKLLCGKNCVPVLLNYRNIIAKIIPEFKPCFDFEQHSRYHCYDIYTHIVKSVAGVPENNVYLRRSMFFHDIGKPPMFTLDENGEGHFKGHAAVSAEMTRKIMSRLRYSNNDIYVSCRLIEHHSDKIKSVPQLKRLLAKLGENLFLMLMEVKKADNSAKREFVLEENAMFDSYADTAKHLIAENSCVALSQLQIKGADIKKIGFRGKAIGETLTELLDRVIDDELPNEREALLEAARSKYNDKR